MAKIQAFIATVMCGFSTFTVIPASNYFRHIPLNSGNITNEAWQMTGSNLGLIIKSFVTKRQENK